MGLQADYDLWHALRKRAEGKGKATIEAVRARRPAHGSGRHRSA
jgi:hypothetical protein